MSRALHTPAELIESGLVDATSRAQIEAVAGLYAIALTPSVIDLIDPHDPYDPIARQFVPTAAELKTEPEERSDPIGDAAFSPVEGIVHRYADRVLLKLLHVCPVYCRFCFRRTQVGPGAESHLSPNALDAAFAYIAAHPHIWEVILTGGDPLTLSARRLEDVVKRLASISHVKILRIHTRIPCVDPEAITPELVDVLKASGKSVYVVLHANHPRELTQQAQMACARFIDAGIPLLSQSVLLRGVNDNVETLSALLRKFVECRIKPYYLHHLDLAPGTSHFRVPIPEGQALMLALQGHMSGLCLPRYMLDLPGGFGKIPIDAPHLRPLEDETGFEATDRAGHIHTYPPPR